MSKKFTRVAQNVEETHQQIIVANQVFMVIFSSAEALDEHPLKFKDII